MLNVQISKTGHCAGAQVFSPAGDQLRRPDRAARPLRGLGMIRTLIHIALISAKAVLAVIATILIVPGLGIAGTVWYMRRRRARKLRPQIALEALNQRYALGDIGRSEYLQNRDDILAAQRSSQVANRSIGWAEDVRSSRAE
jgi:uncharacterized membrane protein